MPEAESAPLQGCKAPSALNLLSIDVLSNILLFLDVDSAQNVLQCCDHPSPGNQAVTQHVWQNMFVRHGFSPRDCNGRQSCLKDLLHRRQLFQALTAPSRNCLPQSAFFFLPILPDDDDDDVVDDDLTMDPPPVNFECESFLLTSTGTSPEFVLLNPFTGVLNIYPSILEHAHGDAYHQDTAGAVVPCRRGRHRRQPTQTLLSVQDFVDFVHHPLMTSYFHASDEIVVGHLGMECKLRGGGNNTAHPLISLGRQWSLEDDSKHLTEVLSYEHTAKYVCRFPHRFWTMELCATHNVLYVNPEHDNEECGATFIHVYAVDNSVTELAVPLLKLQCQQKVEAMAVSLDGQWLMVEVQDNALQLWNVATERRPTLHCSVSITKELHVLHQSVYDDTNLNRTSLGRMEAIRVSQHVPTERFVTLHAPHRLSSSQIALWTMHEGTAHIVAVIHLPLSARRSPKIHYDGRRLIVFGQDHIGTILLIYHIRTSNDELHLFTDGVCGHEGSGGVTPWTDVPLVRFVNRIRHVALGGIEAFDSIHMSCNERFIVVNTKTGNHLSGGSTDGLLVIDLEQAERSDKRAPRIVRDEMRTADTKY